MGAETGAQTARSQALAVLRIRSRALALALLPAACAVVLFAARATGRAEGGGWDVLRQVVTVVAVLVLVAAAAVAVAVVRSRPAMTPTVEVAERDAPDLYRLVRDLADRLEVPAPSGIALTPDCDSWLEDRTHPAHGPRARPAALPAPGAPDRPVAPVLVIGSPFLWWMRVGELRAVLAPVVAGTGPSAHPDIAAARRFVRGLDAAVAESRAPGAGPLRRVLLAGTGRIARALLRACGGHAAEMERGVASAAAERAQAVDYGLRIVAQEQVGLAYAGWDRLLTRVALPAWRMGRWPSRLDAGVVAALTELSRRDRLADGFASRLGERPACDLLEEPGAMDEAASLLAARLFHGGPAESGPDWSPVGWPEYPEEVVDRTWRTDAARLHRVLDDLGVRLPAGPTADASAPTLARVLEHLAGTVPSGPGADGAAAAPAQGAALPSVAEPGPVPGQAHPPDAQVAAGTSEFGSAAGTGDPGTGDPGTANPGTADPDDVDPDTVFGSEQGEALAARIIAEVAREEAQAPQPAPPTTTTAGDEELWNDGSLPLFPLQPPRTGRELLVDHVTAMVCCSAVDTAGAAPGLDWLDGPVLLVGGERAGDLGSRVQSLIADGDPGPLRDWLTRLGVRPEKPVRLV